MSLSPSSRGPRRLSPVWAVCFLLSHAAVPRAAELIQNGNFELPGGGIRTEFVPGSTFITDWTTTDGAVMYRGDGDFDDPEGIEGGNCVVLGPYWSSGGIQQTFAAVTGQVYSVSFYAAADPNNGTNAAILRVSAAGVVAIMSTQPPSRNQTDVGWVLKKFSFISDVTGAATLKFQNLGTNVGVDGIAMIDGVDVVSGLPVETVPRTNSVPQLLLQTGLFEQVVRVTNPTLSSLPAVRVLVSGLPAAVRVYNASGHAGGVPYVQSNVPLPPGGTVDLTVEYYIPDRSSPPAANFSAEVAPPMSPAVGPGAVFPIDRFRELADGSVLVGFSTLSDRIYFVQYSPNLSTWRTAFPSIKGTGSRVQWLDNGPPKTESHPRDEPDRFYRVVLIDSPQQP